MKKVYVCLLALCLLALAFFTVYGESLYEIGKPRVQTATVSRPMDETFLQIPQEALYEDEASTYVYVVVSEKGYSRTIHTVERRAVTVIERTEGGYVKLESDEEVQRGDLVVVSADAQIAHRSRVLLLKS